MVAAISSPLPLLPPQLSPPITSALLRAMCESLCRAGLCLSVRLSVARVLLLPSSRSHFMTPSGSALPLALPLPSLCPRPAPLLAPQHKGKVNHEAVLDWGIPKRCDWRSQEMVTHAEPAAVGMGERGSTHIPEPRFVWDKPKLPAFESGDAPSWCLGAPGRRCPVESQFYQS